MLNRIIFAIILLLVLSSCKQESIKIGVVGDYQGSNQNLVEDGYKALEMSFKDLGVDDYELFPLNFNEDVSVDELIEQIESNRVDLLVGPFFSNNLLALNEHLVNKAYLTIVTTATSDVLNVQEDYIYRLINSSSSQSRQYAAYIADKGYKNQLVVYDEQNQAYSKFLADSFSKDLMAFNVDSTQMMIDQAFEGKLTDEILSKYDSIVIIAGSKTAGLTTQLIRKNGYEGNIYMSGWSLSEKLFMYIGNETDHVYFFTNTYPQIDHNYPDFIDRFDRDYGRTVSSAAVYCYEIGRFIHYLNGQIDIRKNEEVKSFLDANKIYNGYFFNVEFDEYGNGDVEMRILEIKDESFVLKK